MLAMITCSGNSVSTIHFRPTGHVGDGLLNAQSRFLTSLYARPVAIKSGCGGFLGGLKCIFYELLYRLLVE